MKILLASSLKRRVDKNITASRSVIIYQIASGLVKQGHEVTILGTGDSYVDGAKTIPIIPKAWIDLPPAENPFFRDVATLIELNYAIIKLQKEYDIIHNHVYPEFFTPIIESQLTTPLLTTIHIQPTEYIDTAFSEFNKSYFVSISEAHRRLFKKAHIFKVVYNGINTSLYSFSQSKDDYMLWLGRLSKAKNKDGNFMDPKGVKWAIELAQKTGSRLKLSGNVEDMDFFNQAVKPHLNDKIEWIGPISKEQALTKQEVVSLMQRAKVYLMTVNWYEPFGLVMAESMSCGTPVIGFDRGSVSELIDDGKTGFVVNPDEGMSGLEEAFSKINTIKPEDCRKHVEDNFSVEKMVENYEKTYQEIIAKKNE